MSRALTLPKIRDGQKVSTEGFLHFSGSMSSSDGANTIEKLRNNRIIAPLWDNVKTNGAGDDIFVDTSTAGQLTIRWNATNEADQSDVNFSVTLWSDGDIRFDYGPGNANLTPTIGISRGDGQWYALSRHDARAVLTNAESVEFALVPGCVDIGAYEFLGDSLDSTPPEVIDTAPVVIELGGNTTAQITEIQIAFSERLNPIDAVAPANYELRRAAGGGFDDGSDVVYQLSPTYVFDPVTGSSVVTIDLPLSGVALPVDSYRLVVRGAGLRDTAGNALHGGGPGGDYVREFAIVENTPPVAVNDSYTTIPLDGTQSFSVSAPGVLENDSDANGDPLTAVLVDGPAGLMLNPDGSFSYVPAAGWAGTVSFSYQASDGTALSNVATVTLVFNTPPVANPGGPYVVDFGLPLVLDGSGSSDPDQSAGDSFVLYQWDINNDGIFDWTSTQPIQIVPWSQIASLPQPDIANPIRLRTTDGFGAWTEATTQVTILGPGSDPLQVAGFDVQKGATQRSYIRYLDVEFNQADGLLALLDTLLDGDSTNDFVQLHRYALDGSGTPQTVDMSMATIRAVDHVLEFDFGPGGLGGNPQSYSANGYYELAFDLNGDGQLDRTLNFFRLQGDVTGDGKVTLDDLLLVRAALGLVGDNLETDLNGDSRVTTSDYSIARYAYYAGYCLANGLDLDD